MDGIKEQLEALTTQLKDLQTRVEAFEAVKAKADEVEALSASMKTLTDNVTALTADVTAERARNEKQALLQQAVFSGKEVRLTDDAIAAMSAKDLKAHIEALQATVPLHRRTPDGSQPEQADRDSLIAQFNAIKDPAERAEFWKANRTAIVGVAK